MKVKFQKISEDATIPCYGHLGDAGLDIFSAENILLKVGARKRVRTGIKMELPKGYAGLVWDKSGIAFNEGVKTMGGVIDSGYRGEILIVLVNLGKNNYEIKKGQKIAQLLIQKIEEAKIKIADIVGETSRGADGFGSTGLYAK